MADGYLEKRQVDYEARKAAWLSKKVRKRADRKNQIDRPDDEAL
jgi:hypothetical protein